MITLASIIERFEAPFLAQYGAAALPSHRKALSAMKLCRSSMGPRMLAQCSRCEEQRFVPHSCGQRNCPHCQHFESQRWIERQTSRLVPGSYFLVTFTLPAELRSLAWQHQRVVYAALMECAWDTLRTFSQNHKQLQGTPGAVAVLHTHSRQLAFHPHVHMCMPAAALNADKGLWRSLRKSTKGDGYLFSHKALAKVFRAKLLAALVQAGLALPTDIPKDWVVDCTSVGSGGKALVYLGRYLYRGVIAEKDILHCTDGQVTYRWRDSKTKKMGARTVSGAQFLWLILQHVLPKGFRRARNFGLSSTPTANGCLHCSSCWCSNAPAQSRPNRQMHSPQRVRSGSARAVVGSCLSCAGESCPASIPHQANQARRIRSSNWHYRVRAPAPIGCCDCARPKTPAPQSRASQNVPQRHQALAMRVYMVGTTEHVPHQGT